jgi:hypothetical protein
MSGDKAGTPNTDESWDSLFSRYPWISELYIYSLIRERFAPLDRGLGVAYWSNLFLYRASLKLTFTPKDNLSFAYNYMLANEPVDISQIKTSYQSTFGDGKNRGQLMQIVYNHIFNDHISGHLWAECLLPGDFYANRDTAYFFRWQIEMKF